MKTFMDSFALVLLFCVTGEATYSICRNTTQYDRCSPNSACGCFHMPGAVNTGICGFLWTSCSQLVSCKAPYNSCEEPGAICVQHPRCQNQPVCYPVSMIEQDLCPSIPAVSTTTTRPTTTTTRRNTTPYNVKLDPNTKWAQNGTIHAGSVKRGEFLNQLSNPNGIFMAEFGVLYIADYQNSRVVEWLQNAKEGKVVAGNLGAGNGTGQLSLPSAVIYDEGTRSLIVCDYGNRRVVQVSLAYGGLITDVLIENIKCMGLAMDNEAFLYVSDGDNHEVRRYQIGNPNGTLVAGGNGAGSGLNQLNTPYGLVVDQQRSVYVADHKNHRVMRWKNGAKQGVIVAGGQGSGSDLSRVTYPTGIFVDTFDSLYVSDSGNNRVVRWRPSATQGTTVVGGNGGGEKPNQVYGPEGLYFDKDGNLYVACQWSDRVLRFDVLKV